MKLRSSHLAAAILITAGTVVGLALLRSSGPAHDVPAKGGTDTFLDQVERLRESGGGSANTQGIVPSSAADLSKHGKLEFSESPVEMGTISNKEKTQKRVAVRNTGSLPIDITEIRTSCHCTEGEFERAAVGPDGKRTTTIGPGREETLVVTVDPARVHGFEAHKVLTLVTNDPITFQYELPVNSFVDPELALEPDTIDFGTVERGSPAEVRAVIRQLTEEQVDITIASVNQQRGKSPKKTETPPVTFDLAKRPESEWKTPGRAEWDLTAHLSPEVEPGPLQEILTLTTTAKRLPQVDFKIVGTVETFYSVDPGNLGAHDAATPGQTHVAKTTITGRVPIAVAAAAVSGEGLAVETVPQSDPNKVDVFVNVLPGAAPGLKNETVTFTVEGGGRSVQHTMRAFVSVQSSAAPAK